jgi:hypothetical protein
VAWGMHFVGSEHDLGRARVISSIPLSDPGLNQEFGMHDTKTRLLRLLGKCPALAIHVQGLMIRPGTLKKDCIGEPRSSICLHRRCAWSAIAKALNNVLLKSKA